MKKIEFKNIMIIKFIWASALLLLGAAIGVHNGFEGAAIGAAALVTLALADIFIFTVKKILAHAGIGNGGS